MTDKLNESALKELFGRAIAYRLVKNGFTRPGKHSRPACCHYFHPPGTKLVRRFIRRARGEQTAYRALYATMTGHQLP